MTTRYLCDSHGWFWITTAQLQFWPELCQVVVNCGRPHQVHLDKVLATKGWRMHFAARNELEVSLLLSERKKQKRQLIKNEEVLIIITQSNHYRNTNTWFVEHQPWWQENCNTAKREPVQNFGWRSDWWSQLFDWRSHHASPRIDAINPQLSLREFGLKLAVERLKMTIPNEISVRRCVTARNECNKWCRNSTNWWSITQQSNE